ncbi:hypothetical protein EPUS_05433 [Endocarpon pusillum Z07020]|uniref:Amidase domain-containing protein n=1 Tax=Endocarpon pusillum (strain Z07020 / HMAS-L-300199) TaxID=1263415 RepID=U1GDU4_ENDPU|nr:uncharacterized protein EPUS_05433 [Endocarpon pusillum Z07020]ERF69891.1 hypothetical protein EPUS_05433 [Endocarpon pusillum Z07020]
MSEEAKKPRFWNYPPPKQGPDVFSVNNAAPNPVLRGYPLAVAAWIVASSSFVSNIFWKNAKFDQLQEVKELDAYDPRYDPTVIPITPPSDAKPVSLNDLPAPKPRQHPQQHYTSGDYVSLYQARKLTPSDVVEVLISLISKEAGGEHSIAFLQCRADLIRQAAQASTRRYQEGKPLGPLDGVPVAVKDEVDLKGYKRTLGSAMDFTNKDDETAWCVKQWEDAGAIVIGKTNMHEIGLDTTNNNPHTGTPPNPHNPSHYCGGSSGGSAYSVSTGLVPIALGSDGGGSIRIPSSLCGIYGLKPTHGRVSGHPTRDLGVSVGVYGPMASNLDDLRLGYRVMAKPDPSQALGKMEEEQGEG